MYTMKRSHLKKLVKEVVSIMQESKRNNQFDAVIYRDEAPIQLSVTIEEYHGRNDNDDPSTTSIESAVDAAGNEVELTTAETEDLIDQYIQDQQNTAYNREADSGYDREA